jgi:hypothetical protein
MNSVMSVFSDGGWWDGRLLFLDPQQDVAKAITGCSR